MLRHLPNALTVARVGLAVAFPFVPDSARLAVVLAALATEYLDGALARALELESELGVLLDPIADKLFFVAVAATFVFDGSLSALELLALGTRDVAVALFGLALALRGRRESFAGLRPGILGKVTTTLQYAAFVPLLLGRPIHPALIAVTAATGAGAAWSYFMRYRGRLETEKKKD